MKMTAFVKVGEVLIKAYEQGDDWQTLDNNGKECWRSKWSVDAKGSLFTALDRHALTYGYSDKSVINDVIVVESVL